MIDAIQFTSLVVFLWFNLLFVLATLKKDNSIVDIGWGLGFILVAWTNLIRAGSWTLVKIVMLTLVTVWGLRLSLHIYNRNKNKAEDWRYKAWRKAWGKWLIPRSYLQVFMLQAALTVAVSLPVIQIAISHSNTTAWIAGVGLGVWLIGFVLETLADYQLTLHIDEGKKNILTTGVWSISRHPNYFGEALLWWGIGIISISTFITDSYSAANILWSIGGPVTITFLLRYVSGVPLLEKKFINKPGFKKYMDKTPIFTPWPWRINK